VPVESCRISDSSHIVAGHGVTFSTYAHCVGPVPRYHSLDDFLASKEFHVDALCDDGWGYKFPVKGYETDATVLFADISGFSTRTLDMSPAATLIYVQTFFAWITAEALHNRPGIVDKYIGDEVMVVFSEEFGSEDPLVDAVRAAAAMSKNDVHSYSPHIGIASGRVIIGYAGTPLRYNVSVFGAPVALAARCAGVRLPKSDEPQFVSSTIVMPEAEWGDRSFDEVLPLQKMKSYDGEEYDEPRVFELQPSRDVDMKGLGTVAVREIYNTGMHMSTVSAENRARDALHAMWKGNRYWPRWEAPEAGGGMWSHMTPVEEPSDESDPT
jgi:hypothetical protein